MKGPLTRRAVVVTLLVVVPASVAPAIGPMPARADDPVITAAGDIAQGGEPSRPQRQTARLVISIDPTAVLTLGDNQYPSGRLSDFRASYDPTWGRFKDITHPVPGNHEYLTARAQGYFRYFHRRAHRSTGGYYSFDLGAWHLVAVNSGRWVISDAQLRFVRRDLRQSDATCELAYWHNPRFSSGAVHGSNPAMGHLWRVLFRAGVDVVLNGHEHSYERFARLAPSGRRAPRRGIREFVVGTGGAGTYPFGDPIRGSRVRITGVHGVLEMTLRPHRYDWAFVRTDGKVLDDGRDHCHP